MPVFFTIKKPYSLHSMFPKRMISGVVVFEGWVSRVVYHATHQHQWLLGTRVKFSQTAVAVLKNSL